jgi:hypothetical protein
MSVYVDDLRHTEKNAHWQYVSSCHLWADTESELDEFAKRIGMNPIWKQKDRLIASGIHFVHFDLTVGKRRQAVAYGAVERSLKSWLKEKRSEPCQPSRGS